jgi:hypothetical protein
MRLQFEFRPDRVQELDELVQKLGLRSRVQLLDLALAGLEWMVEERELGRVIASLNEDTGAYKELVMPGFQLGKAVPLPPPRVPADVTAISASSAAVSKSAGVSEKRSGRYTAGKSKEQELAEWYQELMSNLKEVEQVEARSEKLREEIIEKVSNAPIELSETKRETRPGKTSGNE